MQSNPKSDNSDLPKPTKLGWICAHRTCTPKANWARDKTTWVKVITCMRSSLLTACIRTDSQATTITAPTNTLHPSSNHRCTIKTSHCLITRPTKQLKGRNETVKTQIKCNIYCKNTPKTQLGQRRPAKEFRSRVAWPSLKCTNGAGIRRTRRTMTDWMFSNNKLIINL